MLAIIILLAFFYLVSTAAALLLSLMQDDDIKHRYLFLPVLNAAWFIWSLVKLLARPHGSPVFPAPGPDTELSRRDAINSTLKPPM